MRLIDADYLKNLPFERIIHTDFGDTAIPIEEIDNAPTVEPCYQTTSCLDCGNYDKENHNCPRYCEVIKEAIKSRPQGTWKWRYKYSYYCSNCGNEALEEDEYPFLSHYCPFCGAEMEIEQ
jgi:hypothetical protein